MGYVDEMNLLNLQRHALHHPLDGQRPPEVAVLMELPLERVAQVILATERRAGAAGTERWWNVVATVRSAMHPQGEYLDCQDAARVACERALDGVGLPMAAWSWDPLQFIGRLRCELTDQESRTMALSQELPVELDARETWYMRDMT